MNRNRTDKMGMQKKHDHESGFFEDNSLPDEKHKRMINHFGNNPRETHKSNSRQKRSFVNDKSASTSATKMRRTDDGPAHSERNHQNNSVKSSKEVSKVMKDEQKCVKIQSVGSNSSDVILIKDNLSDSDRKKCSNESSSANHRNKKSRREREENETYLRELEVASTIRNNSEYRTYIIFLIDTLIVTDLN